MRYFLQTILLVCCTLQVSGQVRKLTPVEKTSFHQLGDRLIAVKTTRYGTNAASVLVNLHHNEVTSLEAAHSFLSANGGMLINIENDNERFISFFIGKAEFRFDPNRIFSDAGIRQTLSRLNNVVTPAAFRAVKRFAGFIKGKLPASARTIIAVHNNEEGELSVNSYTNGGDMQKDASLVHKASRHDADNFFLTTSSALYRKLKAAGYNVVLQHNKKANDDGSLSVYYGRKKRSYVNVEAETGRYVEQLQMLEVLWRSMK